MSGGSKITKGLLNLIQKASHKLIKINYLFSNSIEVDFSKRKSLKSMKIRRILQLFFNALSLAVEANNPERRASFLEINEDVEKADNDKREFRYLELKNRMKVVLVKDSLAVKDSVSLGVSVGMLEDPP